MRLDCTAGRRAVWPVWLVRLVRRLCPVVRNVVLYVVYHRTAAVSTELHFVAVRRCYPHRCRRQPVAARVGGLEHQVVKRHALPRAHHLPIRRRHLVAPRKPGGGSDELTRAVPRLGRPRQRRLERQRFEPPDGSRIFDVLLVAAFDLLQLALPRALLGLAPFVRLFADLGEETEEGGGEGSDTAARERDDEGGEGCVCV